MGLKLSGIILQGTDITIQELRPLLHAHVHLRGVQPRPACGTLECTTIRVRVANKCYLSLTLLRFVNRMSAYLI